MFRIPLALEINNISIFVRKFNILSISFLLILEIRIAGTTETFRSLCFMVLASPKEVHSSLQKTNRHLIPLMLSDLAIGEIGTGVDTKKETLFRLISTKGKRRKDCVGVEPVLPIGLEFSNVRLEFLLLFRRGKAQPKVLFRPSEIRPAFLVPVTAQWQNFGSEEVQKLPRGYSEQDQVFVFRLDH